MFSAGIFVSPKSFKFYLSESKHIVLSIPSRCWHTFSSFELHTSNNLCKYTHQFKTYL